MCQSTKANLHYSSIPYRRKVFAVIVYLGLKSYILQHTYGTYRDLWFVYGMPSYELNELITTTSTSTSPWNKAVLFSILLPADYLRWSYDKVLILLEASNTFSLLPNALTLRYSSPPGPNPTPGMVTMCVFSRISSNMSHELDPGKCTKA